MTGFGLLSIALSRVSWNRIWWIEGDTPCRRWDNWREQKPDACFTVADHGETAIWYRADGAVYREWRVARSDPGSQVAYEDQPPCADVGGYEAYMARSGKPRQYAEADPYE